MNVSQVSYNIQIIHELWHKIGLDLKLVLGHVTYLRPTKLYQDKFPE